MIQRATYSGVVRRRARGKRRRLQRTHTKDTQDIQYKIFNKSGLLNMIACTIVLGLAATVVPDVPLGYIYLFRSECLFRVVCAGHRVRGREVVYEGPVFL